VLLLRTGLCLPLTAARSSNMLRHLVSAALIASAAASDCIGPSNPTTPAPCKPGNEVRTLLLVLLLDQCCSWCCS